MTSFVRACVTCVAVLTCAGTAAAQGSYVGASIFGDIVRTSHTEDNPGGGSGGEAVGFTLRIGTPVGATWGVEAEFAYPGEIEQEGGPVVFPLNRPVNFTNSPGFSWTSISFDPSTLPLILPSTFRTSARNTTFSASLWFEQQLTDRFSLVYLAGAGFHRTTSELEIEYVPRLGIPIVLPPFESESTHYGVRPMVGLESRFGLTDHVQLVPGIRLHASDGTWLVRPLVGLNWIF